MFKRGFFVLILFSLLSLGSFAQALKFKDSTHNFGKITQGELVTMEFEVENTSSLPLLISDMKVTCGCTKSIWPKEPIKQGEKKIIKVTFDSKGKYDRQDRTIEVISNDPGSPHKLRFKGVVLKPKN